MPKSTKRIPSNIPVGTQFSPDLINLDEFLKGIIANSGNKNAMLSAVWAPPVHLQKDGVPTSRRTASLPLEAAVQYGLLTKGTYEITPLTTKLSTFVGQKLYEEFARHIMLNLGGLRVVEAAQQMKIDGLKIGGDSLALYCTNQGFHVSMHNTAINTLRMWLAKAGIFSENDWDVDSTQKQKIVGLSDGIIAALANLTQEQQAFAKTLCRINPPGWYKASDVRDLAETTYGVQFGRSSLPKDVLEPLKQAGLIEYNPGGTKSGKSATLNTTADFNTLVLEPFISETIKTLNPVIITYYRTRPADIYADLKSTNTFTKGKALEAYAIHIMRLLGLHFLNWRKRAKDTTGSAEVDVLLTGLMGLTATRWQVQCKNTPSGSVDLEDVAKEVGLIPITHATHILLIANCKVTRDAKQFAITTMLNSSLTIHLLDKKDYAKVEASPGAIGEIIRNQAEEFALQKPKDNIWSTITK